MNKKLSQEQLARYIAIISLILWLVSLGLVGFITRNEEWYGIEILINGILLGWVSPSWWTVYSNIFYVVAILKLLAGKKTKHSIEIMVILGVTVLFSMLGKAEIMTNITNFGTGPSRVTIISWGWGIMFLLFAQFLVVISGLVRYGMPFYAARICISFFILPIIGVGAFSAYQRNQANDWEMKHYFPTYDIAFTKEPLSGLPSKPLAEKLSDDATIEIKFIDNISPLIEEDENAYPNVYWLNGKFWKKYYGDIFSDFAITIEKSSRPTYYVEVTNPKSQYYLFTVYKRKSNEILYQQPFKVIKDKKGRDRHTKPSLYELPDEISYIEKNRQKKQPLWQSEKGQEQCTVKKIVTDNLNEIWQLDEHQLRIFDYDRYKGVVDSGFYPNHSLCSANYILAFHYDKEEKSADINAWLFERKTGFPVAKFKYHNDYKNPRKFTETIFNQFELVTIEKQKNEEDKFYIILYSDKGDVRLSLREKEQKIYR